MIFSTLVGVLNWSRAVSITTDSAPSMIGKKAGIATKFKEKVRVVSGGREFWTFHCISHQEALCCKSSKMDHIIQVVVRTVNFIRTTGLDHRQFDSLLSDKAFFIYVGKLKILCANNHFQISLNFLH